MRSLAIAGAFAIGCGDPVIELSFELPRQQDVPADFDVSCVGAVDVLALGNDYADVNEAPDFEIECVDLPKSPSSFSDIQSMLRGKIDIPVPESGLDGMAITGRMGRCEAAQPYHESVFYGGALVSGDSIRVPLEANVNCASQTMYTVRAIDLFALIETGQCQTKPSEIFAATIRPWNLGDDYPTMAFEFGTDGADSPTGVVSLKSFASSGATTCVAMGASSGADSSDYGGGGCTNPLSKPLCASPGELEVAMMPFGFNGKSRDDLLLDQYGEPVIGAVFTRPADATAAKTPIIGATITVEDTAGSKIIYAAPDANRTSLVDTGRTSTNETGFFVVYLKGMPTRMTVSAPGHAPATYTVASSTEWPATLIVGLDPI